MFRYLAFIAALTLTVEDCKRDATAPLPPIAGQWIGPIGSQQLSITIVENSGVVNGNGTISRSTGPLAIAITGTFSRPKLSIICTSGTLPPVNVSASLTDAGIQLIGTANGSGFDNATVVLNRQN